MFGISNLKDHGAFSQRSIRTGQKPFRIALACLDFYWLSAAVKSQTLSTSYRYSIHIIMPSVAILLPIIGAISVSKSCITAFRRTMGHASLTTHNFLAATGINEPHHMSLISRQLDSSTIPAACQPTCQSAMSIYSDCTSNDISGCRKVCQQSTFNEFIDCLDCTSEQLAMTTSEQSLLNNAVEQLKDVCGQTGSSVTGTLA